MGVIKLFLACTKCFIYVANNIITLPIFRIFCQYSNPYSFIGLELVAVEMDDPFGNDANDFE